MRELTYYVACSVDGRIAGPDGDSSMFAAEGDHMDVVTGRFRDAVPGAALDVMGLRPDLAVFDTVVMGWNTYAVGLPAGVDDPYPHLRQYVATSRSGRLPAGVHRTDDPAATVRDLREEPGGSGVWLCGGGRLASALADRIDRLVLKVNPVVIGGDGIPLFHGTSPGPLALERSTRYGSGVVISEYRRVR
ncbi:dihydrofolate reductase family protein [Jatrophihabitans fulvus]